MSKRTVSTRHAPLPEIDWQRAARFGNVPDVRPRGDLPRCKPCAYALGLGLGLGGCSDPGLDAAAVLPQVERMLTPFGLDPEVVPSDVAWLRWRGPTDACTHAYRIESTYMPALRFEDNSTSLLLMSPDPEAEDDEAFTTGRLFYRGVRAEKHGLSRAFRWSSAFFGPASPTAACLPQTWDPIDDALALGWPRLPDRLTAVGERWTGLRVGAKCNWSACVDPETGAGGPEHHQTPCVTRSWDESLEGVFEIAGERVALVSSTWTDGHTDPAHGGDRGVWSERRALVSITHGRPLVVEFVLHFGFGQPIADDGSVPVEPPDPETLTSEPDAVPTRRPRQLAAVERRYVLTAIDACPGSLAALGWPRPREVEAAASTRP